MKNFKNYLLDKEEENINKQINEDILSFGGTVLGIGSAALLLAWGGSLLVKGALALPKFWKGMLGPLSKQEKKVKPIDIVTELKNDKTVIMAVEKSKEEKVKIEGLEKVFIAIEEKNEQLAIDELKISGVKPSPIVNRVLIGEISKAFEEPPIHYGNTGNECYKFIKGLLGIKTAQIAATIVKEALKKQSIELSKEYLEEPEEPKKTDQTLNSNV